LRKYNIAKKVYIIFYQLHPSKDDRLLADYNNNDGHIKQMPNDKRLVKCRQFAAIISKIGATQHILFAESYLNARTRPIIRSQ